MCIVLKWNFKIDQGLGFSIILYEILEVDGGQIVKRSRYKVWIDHNISLTLFRYKNFKALMENEDNECNVPKCPHLR